MSRNPKKLGDILKERFASADTEYQLHAKNLKEQIQILLTAEKSELLLSELERLKPLFSTQFDGATGEQIKLELEQLKELNQVATEIESATRIDHFATLHELATMRACAGTVTGLFGAVVSEDKMQLEGAKDIEVLQKHDILNNFALLIGLLTDVISDVELPLEAVDTKRVRDALLQIAHPLYWMQTVAAFTRDMSKYEEQLPEEYFTRSEQLLQMLQEMLDTGCILKNSVALIRKKALITFLKKQYTKAIAKLDDFVSAELAKRLRAAELTDEYQLDGDDFVIQYGGKYGECRKLSQEKAQRVTRQFGHFFARRTVHEPGAAIQIGLPSIFRVAEEHGLCRLRWAQDPDWGKSKIVKQYDVYDGKEYFFCGAWDCFRTDQFCTPFQVLVDDPKTHTRHRTSIADLYWTAGYVKWAHKRPHKDQLYSESTQSIYNRSSGLTVKIDKKIKLRRALLKQKAEELDEKFKARRRKIAYTLAAELQDIDSELGGEFALLCNNIERIRLLCFHLLKLNGVDEFAIEDFLKSKQKIVEDLSLRIRMNVNQQLYYTHPENGFIFGFYPKFKYKEQFRKISAAVTATDSPLWPISANSIFEPLYQCYDSMNALKRYVKLYRAKEQAVLDRAAWIDRHESELHDVSDDESEELLSEVETIDGVAATVVCQRGMWYRDWRDDGSYHTLGDGSLGVKVYSGKLLDEEMRETPVAIKTFPQDEMQPGSLLHSMFFNEMRCMRMIDSPKVVRCHQMSRHKSRTTGQISHSLLLEKATTTLEAYLKKCWQEQRRLSPEEQKQLTLEIAEGLALVHEHGIIHRDIKVDNVLLFANKDGSYRAKLSDFGISLPPVDDLDEELEEQMGPDHWQAPELLLGVEPSFETDMFSFALLVWRIANHGAPLFAETDAAYEKAENLYPASGTELLKKYVKDPGYRLKIPDECPEILRTIINACWCNLYNDLKRMQRLDGVRRMSATEVVEHLQAPSLEVKPQ